MRTRWGGPDAAGPRRRGGPRGRAAPARGGGAAHAPGRRRARRARRPPPAQRPLRPAGPGARRRRLQRRRRPARRRDPAPRALPGRRRDHHRPAPPRGGRRRARGARAGPSIDSTRSMPSGSRTWSARRTSSSTRSSASAAGPRSPRARRPARRGAGRGVPVLAADLPSFVDATTGQAAPEALPARETVTFGAVKAGLLLPGGAELAGTVHLVDLGLEEHLPGPARRRAAPGRRRARPPAPAGPLLHQVQPRGRRPRRRQRAVPRRGRPRRLRGGPHRRGGWCAASPRSGCSTSSSPPGPRPSAIPSAPVAPAPGCWTTRPSRARTPW